MTRLMKRWVLEGGGPWRVLEDCPAEHHCSLAAAYARSGGPRCVCPRSLALYAKELERMRNLARKRREEKASSPQWFREGPWRISAMCKAKGHNNITWARGAGRRKENACTCPRALYLLEEYKKGRRIIERQQRKQSKPTRVALRGNPRVIPPDWGRGACAGKWIASEDEASFNEDVSRNGIALRQAAKDVCQECPLSMFRECEKYIRKVETKPGELGGIYAGMDKWNRQGFELKFISGKIKKVKYDPSEF